MAKATTIKVPPAPPAAPAAPAPQTAPTTPAAPPPPQEPQNASGPEPTPATGSAPAAPPAPSGGEPLQGSSPPAPAPDSAAAANNGNPPENGAVTTNAEAKGAVRARDALDRDDDGSAGGSLSTDPVKRMETISRRGFKDGRNADLNKDGSGRQVKAKPAKWSDAEYDRYVSAYERGVQQKQADGLSTDDRLARIERALGLPVPDAKIDEEDDD